MKFKELNNFILKNFFNEYNFKYLIIGSCFVYKNLYIINSIYKVKLWYKEIKSIVCVIE